MRDATRPSAVWRYVIGVLLLAGAHAEAAEVEFFRGVNLNGPAIKIDGHAWEPGDSTFLVCNDKAFENQDVPLVPATDDARARMLRSSRWGGNRLELTGIPRGSYTLFLYVWEDNNAETYSIAVNGRPVQTNYSSGSTGHWDKLGPWYVEPHDGKILLTSQGGAANFSGIELWRGRHDGENDAPIGEEELAFFEKRIRPVLVNRCYECHSAESDDLAGDLLVDSRATIRKGGSNGPAVVPGDIEHSLLIAAIRYQNDDLQMPPDERLPDEEIADLERWVEMGAPDPRTSATKYVGKPIDVAAARQFWSLKPITKPALPDVQNSAWLGNDIDRFILAKLEEQGMKPAPDAEKRALIRRATYDLTGLPPTPAEVEAFLADDSQDAFDRVVDRLLESPRYGERWGRHWLDVVRYADTAGDNSDYPVPQMHGYRDWVIDAFNRDLPYDEFVRDQLAGDLRGGSTDEERYQRIIATGYIANARRFGSRVDDYPQHLTIEDTIDNVGRTFLGTTLSCARCHDHKFDPIPTRDYYALYGIFESTRYPWPGIELDKRQRDFVPLVPSVERNAAEQKLTNWLKEQTRLDKDVDKLKEGLKKAKDDEKKAIEARLKDAARIAKQHRDGGMPFETAYAVAEAATPGDAAIQEKGNPAQRGDVVPRHFLTVLGGQKLPDDCDASGREQLAEWILDVENPLTARVMANRIWQHHFGRGIVPTPNDFGKQGKPPTHPKLLDLLATSFRESGWSIKSMHRLIMLSHTYRQGAFRDDSAVASDPANEWLSAYPRRRLDAESIRDTLLALGENLDLNPVGPHPFPPQHTWNFTQHNPFKAVYDTNHRSVYLMTQRIQRHPFLAIFDGADPSASTPARTTSTTPLQALYLLNDPFVHEQSRRVADRVMHHTADDEGRIAHTYQLLFARPVSAEELAVGQSFLTRAKEILQDASSKEIEAEAWSAYVRSLFRLNEFVYLD